MPNPSPNPLQIIVTRDPFVESIHLVDALVIDKKGKVIRAFGDIDHKIFPRSAIKPLQALALFTSGAVEKFDLSDAEIALACASHNAESIHTEPVQNWLKKLNLQVTDLECGPQAPYDEKTYHEMICQKVPVTALHNNCSGKHTGMLSVAKALNAPTKSYINAKHPVQKMIRENLQDICNCEIPEKDFGIDGCSVPTFFVSMKSWGLAMARLGAGYSSERIPEGSCQRIYKACIENPLLIEGHGEFCSQIVKQLGGKALVKSGAEGVMAATLSELEYGIVVKSRDGQKRASEVAIGFLLRELGLLKQQSEFEIKPLKNKNQFQVGEIKPSPLDF